jgi:hypothetical protein
VAGVHDVSGHEALLERERELEQIRSALDAARGGRGGVVAVEGGAGTGKNSLLRVAGARAEAQGMRVLQARGSEHRKLGLSRREELAAALGAPHCPE